MIIPGSANPLLAAGAESYQIERSLRFNDDDSAYLSRTPAGAGNRKTYTFSAWVKRGNLSAAAGFCLLNAHSAALNKTTRIRFVSDVLQFNENDTTYNNSVTSVVTTAVFRDPSAWYHVVFSIDTTQATTAARYRIYVNGVQQTVTASVDAGQNYEGAVNYNTAHNIGSRNNAAEYFDGYLTEINFIDGQALTPSSFGQTNAQTGVWEPKAYTSTYGTNGYFLKFADNSNTTAATLGKDSSGNGNNWTPNNFSVTAGIGNDSLVDTPTSYGTDTGAGGEVRGNYCTLNAVDKQSNVTLSNGNLKAAIGSQYGGARGTMFVSSGKWYWEVTVTAIGPGAAIGVYRDTDSIASYPGAVSGSYAYWSDGQKLTNNSASSYGATYTTNDVIAVELDLDAGTISFRKNNTSQGVAFSSISGTFAAGLGDLAASASAEMEINFGQRPFAYTAPSGFKALVTQNLPTPTIGATSTTQANDYFDATTYTGTGLSNNTITNSGSMQPDMLWIKSRSLGAGGNHVLVDAVRGVGTGTNTKEIYPNLTNAESGTASVTSFNSNGFTLTGASGAERYNASGQTYVGWQWNAGGSNATNTSGTITSTVRANTTAGFSIVTYTGTGVNATVGHGLGVAPSLIIIKMRSSPGDQWVVYHSALGANKTLRLDSTGAAGTTTVTWQNTSPSSTVFYIGNVSENNLNNANGKDYVAYCHAAVAGYSAFGSYTGNGSSDGPFVYTGFRPRWILIKNSSATASWYIYDAVRNTFNVVDKLLYPNLSNAEDTYTFGDMLSNGFKIRSTDSGMNSNGNTIIYAAFAESPFKYSLAR